MFVKDFVKIISNLLRNPWEHYESFCPILLNIANREILRFPCWCWINIWWNISFQRSSITEIQKYASNTVPTILKHKKVIQPKCINGSDDFTWNAKGNSQLSRKNSINKSNQTTTLKTKNAKNSVQSTSRQSYDCYLSRDVYAEAFKTICCFTVTIIKEKEVHNVNNLNNHDQEILYELERSNFILRKSQSFLCG